MRQIIAFLALASILTSCIIVPRAPAPRVPSPRPPGLLLPPGPRPPIPVPGVRFLQNDPAPKEDGTRVALDVEDSSSH